MEPTHEQIGGTGDLDRFLGKKDEESESKSEVVEKYRKTIEFMMEDWETYGFAEDFLVSVYDQIIEHGTITEKQCTAVDNIASSIHKRRW